MKNLFIIFCILFVSINLAHSKTTYSLTCTGYADTNINWEKNEKKPSAEAAVKETKDVVKLIDITTKKPKIVGQSITPLTKVSSTGSTVYYQEKTTSGNTHMWVFFQKLKNNKHVLMQLKAYEALGGIRTFTQMYLCE